MNKIRVLSLAMSIFIHTSLIGVMSGSGWIARWIPSIPIKQKDGLALEFVEVPEEVPESKTKKETKTISDKTVSAKDRAEEKIKDRKARARKVSKGKQIAKASLKPQIPSLPSEVLAKESHQTSLPLPQIPDRFSGIEDKQLNMPQVPVQEVPKIEYDIVNIPDVSESIFSTPEEGPLAFETQAHKIGPYFKKVKQRIERYWLSYLVFRYQNTSPQESEAVVSFKILPSGGVTNVSVLEYSGDGLFKDFCVASITNTAPFPPLPERLEKELEKEGGLNIVFTFRYR